MTMRKLFVPALLLIVSLLFVPAFASAYEIDLPYLDWTDGYDYNGTTLTFPNSSVSWVWYMDGSFANQGISSVIPFYDPIVGQSVVIGDLYNDWGGALAFGASGGGSVSYSIGSVFSADLDFFDVTTSCGTSGAPGCVNYDFGVINLSNVNISNSIGSQYLTELESQLALGYDLSMRVTLKNGPATFTAPESGNADGKMVLVPEPISAVLFISGGGLLAARRFRRRTT